MRERNRLTKTERRDELISFTRRFATLCKVEPSVQTALATVAEDCTGESPLDLAVHAVRSAVATGLALTEAMGRHPRVFDATYLAFIRRGEETALLDEAIFQLADLLERERTHERLRAEFRTGLGYPIGPAVIGLLSPSIVALFSRVPWGVKILMFFRFLLIFGWLPVAVALVVWLLLKIPTVRLWWDERQTRLPFVGRLTTNLLVLRFLWRFEATFRAGMAPAEGMMLVAPRLGNEFVTREIRAMATRLGSDTELGPIFAASRFFPPSVGEIVVEAESVGRLDKSLQELANGLQAEVQLGVDRLQGQMRTITLGLLMLLVIIVALSLGA